MKKTILISLSSIVVAAMFTGCASTQPRRIETGGLESITTMGLDMTDFMDAAQRMTRELLVHPSIAQFSARNNGRQPRLDVGAIRNTTRERINIEQVSERVTEELLNSGQVTLVAHDAASVQANKRDAFLSDTKLNDAAQADFYLEGTIMEQIARGGGMQERTYTFQMRLNDRSRSQVWKRSVDISKMGKDTRRRGNTSAF
ncbi:MAG: hypothetical protein GX230_04645 [Lentisphaerae bacterium]|nr:hypothetical protein [Lentisphaerota bacterium]